MWQQSRYLRRKKDIEFWSETRFSKKFYQTETINLQGKSIYWSPYATSFNWKKVLKRLELFEDLQFIKTK